MRALLLFSNLEMNTEAEQQLLHHARNGNADEVRRLLDAMVRKEVVADIDCKGGLPALACCKPHMYLIFPILPMINLTPLSLAELPTILCEIILYCIPSKVELRAILRTLQVMR